MEDEYKGAACSSPAILIPLCSSILILTSSWITLPPRRREWIYKTTLLRILAGKHMVGGKDAVRVLNSSAFQDTSLVRSGDLAYLGESWRKTLGSAGELPLQGDFSAEHMIFGGVSSELRGLWYCFLRDVAVSSLGTTRQNREYYRGDSRLAERGFPRLGFYGVSVFLRFVLFLSYEL
ncbi:hypothetical protein OROGR_025048 [Orobanche gracilis]